MGRARVPLAAVAALLLSFVGFTGAAAQTAPAPGADTTGKKADPPSAPAPPVNHLETTLAGFKLSGFAEGSYAYSGHSLGDTAIVGRLYDRLQNRFMLNALARSEEHTSELQSRRDLVCRLLLEKKKN